MTVELERWVLPEGPIDVDDVLARFPRLRQSILASFDDCALSARWELLGERGWSTAPQARGTLFHRFAGACLKEMVARDAETIPIDVALAILEEVVRQRDVDPRDIVRLPLRELADLEWTAKKWAADNAFSVRNIIAIERRLDAVVSYRRDDGRLIERTITGQLDALISRPPDEAVVLDWKDTWSLPPKRDEDSRDPGLSYHGFFQQQVYGLLVLKNFPSIQAVTLREFYARRSKARPARIVRADLPVIERRLSILVEQVDRALAAGPPATLRLSDLEDQGVWAPSPGRHCFWCSRPHDCPIEDDYTDGGIRTAAEAERAAGARQIARAIDKKLTGWLRDWVDLNGPIPVRRAKGRLVLGYRRVRNGVRFEEYTPEEADRPTTETTYDPNDGLVEAMRDAATRARNA